MKVYVHGLGLWHRSFANLPTWLAGQADPSVVRATAAAFPPPLRRRSTEICKMSCDALCEAQQQAGGEWSRLALVLVSHLGEIATTMEILTEMMDEPAKPVSPTRFHNSVHNAAAGYLSIALGLRRGSSAISAGTASLAMGLLEASMQVSGEQDVALIVTEESGAQPFVQELEFGAGAVAMWLAGTPLSDRPTPWIKLRSETLQPADLKVFLGPVGEHGGAGGAMLHCAHELVRGLAGQRAGEYRVGVDVATSSAWWAEIGVTPAHQGVEHG